jgi:hypothetical protein
LAEFKKDPQRVETLAALAPHLPAEQRQEVLAAATAIGHERYRAAALAALAPHLPAELLAAALAAATAIGDEEPRAKALAALAPHLPNKFKASAVDAILEALARSPRSLAIQYLGAAELVLADVGGKIAVRETAAAIRDVARWWP